MNRANKNNSEFSTDYKEIIRFSIQCSIFYSSLKDEELFKSGEKNRDRCYPELINFLNSINADEIDDKKMDDFCFSYLMRLVTSFPFPAQDILDNNVSLYDIDVQLFILKKLINSQEQLYDRFMDILAGFLHQKVEQNQAGEFLFRLNFPKDKVINKAGILEALKARMTSLLESERKENPVYESEYSLFGKMRGNFSIFSVENALEEKLEEKTLSENSSVHCQSS